MKNLKVNVRYTYKEWLIGQLYKRHEKELRSYKEEGEKFTKKEMLQDAIDYSEKDEGIPWKENSILHVPMLTPVIGDVRFYCTHIDLTKLNFTTFLYHDKFLASPLFLEFDQGKNHLPVAKQNDLIMTIHVKTETLCVYEDSMYDGRGGLLIKAAGSAKRGYVITPLKQWLGTIEEYNN